MWSSCRGQTMSARLSRRPEVADGPVGGSWVVAVGESRAAAGVVSLGRAPQRVEGSTAASGPAVGAAARWTWCAEREGEEAAAAVARAVAEALAAGSAGASSSEEAGPAAESWSNRWVSSSRRPRRRGWLRTRAAHRRREPQPRASCAGAGRSASRFVER
jgi:hypothetical protein